MSTSPSQLRDQQVFGVSIGCRSSMFQNMGRTKRLYLSDPITQYHLPSSAHINPTVKSGKVTWMMNKLGKKADNLANGVRKHVSLGPKITEMVKGKLSLGSRILQLGGMEKALKHLFSAREGEKVLKICRCHLSTTAGPIAGLLFISTDKVAFCSNRSIKVSSQDGKLVRVNYKLKVPLEKIKRVNQSASVKEPSQKYLAIVTVDNHDFWFMGFLNYQKAFKYVQKALSQVSN